MSKITRTALTNARVPNVSMWGHFSTQEDAENEAYQYRYSCLDTWFGNISGVMRGSDNSWAMFHLTRGCWEYRRPYVEEIIEMFMPFFGGDVYIHEHNGLGPRVVYRLQRGMQKEAIHAFNVFLRYSWGHLHQWPIQTTEPDAKSVWQAHLDHLKWDTKPMDYISYSNFCAPTNLCRTIGFTSAHYISIMHDIMLEGMPEFPWDSGSKIPNSGPVTMKRYVFSMALARYARNNAETVEGYDPFE